MQCSSKLSHKMQDGGLLAQDGRVRQDLVRRRNLEEYLQIPHQQVQLAAKLSFAELRWKRVTQKISEQAERVQNQAVHWLNKDAREKALGISSSSKNSINMLSPAMTTTLVTTHAKGFGFSDPLCHPIVTSLAGTIIQETVCHLAENQKALRRRKLRT